MPERLVLGIGNPDRGDDAVGRLVARPLRTRVPADVRIVEHDGEATATGCGVAICPARLADRCRAVRRASPARSTGSIVPRRTLHIPPGTVSSHGFGVAEAIALARALDVLPLQCIVYAIEAADFNAGAAPSREVLGAVDDVVERILAEL